MTRNTPGRRAVRCAIYTRKSSAEGRDQAFTSLDAQREACLAYVLSQKHAGWTALPQRYDDAGLSGGSMERPALRHLLDDVRAGKVDVVLSYKVDRLTRALADFARIVAIFEAAEVAFVSVTEAFDTSTPMGKLTLHVLLSFAQFERELAAERIRDKIAASKARGLWTGGTVPIGYRVEARRLVPVPEEPALVRRIFERYLALGSVTALKVELDAAGIRTPERRHRSGRCSGGAAFSRGRLYDLLANPVFVGRIRHRSQVHPGQHAAIVDTGLWHAVQDQLAANRVSRSLRRGARAPSPLAGRLVDPDGRTMRPSHASRKGRRYRYYVSGDLVDGGAGTGATGWRVPAAEIEAAVARVLAARLRDPEFQAEAVRGCSPAPSASAKLLGGIADLADRLDAPGSISGREALGLVVTRIELSEDGLSAEVRFPAPEAADGPADPALAMLPAFTVTAPLRLQRRGPELRLVLQGPAAPPPRPDPRLV
jgi:site-specific DNA recombinase